MIKAQCTYPVHCEKRNSISLQKGFKKILKSSLCCWGENYDLPYFLPTSPPHLFIIARSTGLSFTIFLHFGPSYAKFRHPLTTVEWSCFCFVFLCQCVCSLHLCVHCIRFKHYLNSLTFTGCLTAFVLSSSLITAAKIRSKQTYL